MGPRRNERQRCVTPGNDCSDGGYEYSGEADDDNGEELNAPELPMHGLGQCRQTECKPETETLSSKL